MKIVKVDGFTYKIEFSFAYCWFRCCFKICFCFDYYKFKHRPSNIFKNTLLLNHSFLSQKQMNLPGHWHSPKSLTVTYSHVFSKFVLINAFFSNTIFHLIGLFVYCIFVIKKLMLFFKISSAVKCSISSTFWWYKKLIFVKNVS